MREYDDVRQLIEEATQNSDEREALNDVVSLLEGNLSAAPRESYRDELRQRLLAEAQREAGDGPGRSGVPSSNVISLARRSRAWMKSPAALGAAAAVLVVALGSAVALSQLGYRAGGSKPLEMAKASQTEPAQEAGGTMQSFGAPGEGLADNQAAAFEAGTGVTFGPSVAGDGTAIKGLARSAAQDAALVKVPGGAAEFRLEAPLPVAPSEANGLHLRQLTLAPEDVRAAAGRLGLQGEVQSGFDHLWVGAPSAGQPVSPDQPVSDSNLPPYKQPGYWLIASPDWGSGWSFSFRDDRVLTEPAAGMSPADAERAARSFLGQVGLDSSSVLFTVRSDGPGGSYWLDWRLTSGGQEVRGVGGGIRVASTGRVIYASWPAFAAELTQARQVVAPDTALQQLRTMPFDWFRSDPKLTVTQVALVYRLPPSMAGQTEVDLDLAYEFTVRDADGTQSALYVSAWR